MTLPTWEEALSTPITPSTPKLPTWDEATQSEGPSAFGKTMNLAKAYGAFGIWGSKDNYVEMGEAQREFMKGTAVGRVMDAFGHGFSDTVSEGGSLGMSPETEKMFQDAGIFNDYSKGQHSILKSFTEVVAQPAAAALDATVRGLGGLFTGYQNAAVQAGTEVGSPALGRDLALLPEAFPTGFKSTVGIPEQIALAKTNRVIGDSEAVYMGTKEPTPQKIEIEKFEAPKIEAETPIVEAPSPTPPTIHEIARQNAPDVFLEYDRLQTQREVHGRWMQELSEKRKQDAIASAPHTAEIAELEAKLTDANARKAKIYQSQIDELTAKNEAAIAEAISKDSADIARVRAGYQDIDFRMRDMSQKVSAAYRKAEESMPVSEVPNQVVPDAPIEAPAVVKVVSKEEAVAAEAKMAELERKLDALPENAPERANITKEMDALADEAVQRYTPEQANYIVSDVSKKLVAAGRPQIEAEAAAQLIAEHYKAIAEQGWSKGTARQIYQRDAANIKAGKSHAKTKEMAQVAKGKIAIAQEKARATITLFKSADASTFIHETGHAWLEEMMMYAKETNAPASLLDSMKTVKEYLGVKGDTITTKQHEKFARSFERYLMEGVAPSQKLAGVFAQFKQWLTNIYKTVEKLRAPITDDIRHVFDRLLSANPEKTVIAPDKEPGKILADIHEADAKSTPVGQKEPVASNIREEVDHTTNVHEPEVYDGIKEAEVGRNEAAASGDGRNASEAGSATGEAGIAQEYNPIYEGGVEPQRVGHPGSPNAEFGRAESNLVDKAGNIRLDNLNTPEDINQILRETAQENGGFVDARRGVITDAQALDLADALGMDAGSLNMRKIGQAYNAEQIIAARKLLIQSATDVRDLMKKAANGTEADIMNYAEAKTRHMMIQEQVSGITAEAGRALRAFHNLEGATEAKLLNDFLKDNTGKTLFQLQEEARMGASLDTPQKLSKFINDSKKASFSDMAIEYWINALLSGPKTHVTNILSNALTSLYSIPESALSAGIGKVLKSEDRVYLDEAKARFFGIMQGAQDGVVAAKKAFKDEIIPDGTIEQRRFQAIPSKKVTIAGREMELGGKQIRIPGRLLSAEDEIFKAIASRQELNALAYRTAAKEGLSGDKLAQRIADILQNPSEEIMKKAHEAAKYQTFTKDLGQAGQAVQRFANSHPAIKFVIPFIRTPTNILKYAGERTPLGLFSKAVRDNLSGKNGTIARDTQISRMTLGSTIGISAAYLAAQGNITGGGPTDPRQMALLRSTGWQPYSVKIGDTYYAYNRFEPFGTILGVSADMTEIGKAMSDADAEKMATMVMAAISKNLTSKTWLQGPSDLIQAISDPDRYGSSYVKRFAGSVIPSIVAQSAQTVDPIMREARTTLDQLKSRIPGLSQTLMPRRDIWGEPITKEGGLGPDLVSPIYESRIKNDPVNKALMDLKIYPSKPDRKIRGVELTDAQYDEYAKLSGKMAKMRLDVLVNTPGFSTIPEFGRIEAIKNILDKSRESARSIVMMKNPDIIKQAMDNKFKDLRK